MASVAAMCPALAYRLLGLLMAVCFGSLCGSLGASLAASWGLLEASWRLLARSWGGLGALVGGRGRAHTWGRLGATGEGIFVGFY